MDGYYLQQLANTLMIGGVYACVGIGFSLVYGVMNIINIAHGSMIMLGGYTTYFLFQSLGMDPFLSIPVSMAIFYIIGYYLQIIIINKVMGKSVFMTMILTFGISAIFLNIVLLLWQSSRLTVTPIYASQVLNIGHIALPYTRIGIFLCAVVLTLLLFLFMNYTKTGNAIKATALSKEAAQLMGVNVKKIYAITYAIASALAAGAGSMIVMAFTVSPSTEATYLTKGFVIAVLGGFGNMAGAIIGGITLAAAETFGTVFFGSTYQLLFAYAIFLLVLVIRPQGIVGKRFYGEVEK